MQLLDAQVHQSGSENLGRWRLATSMSTEGVPPTGAQLGCRLARENSAPSRRSTVVLRFHPLQLCFVTTTDRQEAIRTNRIHCSVLIYATDKWILLQFRQVDFVHSGDLGASAMPKASRRKLCNTLKTKLFYEVAQRGKIRFCKLSAVKVSCPNPQRNREPHPILRAPTSAAVGRYGHHKSQSHTTGCALAGVMTSPVLSSRAERGICFSLV